MCPFRADFEIVPNFFPTYQIVQDIAKTVKCLQIISQTQIYISFYFILTPSMFLKYFEKFRS